MVIPRYDVEMYTQMNWIQDQVATRDRTTGCWEWPHTRLPSGYGHVWDGDQKVYTHRVSFGLALGRDIRPGLHVLHLCDNKPCFNPAHLYEGSLFDNARDARERGQVASRERHGRSKLSEADVRIIREDRSVSGKDAAVEYGVSPAQISRIRTGKRWGAGA